MAMTASDSRPFDPYHKWLGIREGVKPPNYYRLLGLELWEDDEEVIRDAAARQINHLRTFKHGRYHDYYEQLLDELLAARNTLLEPELRTEYVMQLKQELSEAEDDEQASKKANRAVRAVASIGNAASSTVIESLTCADCGGQNIASCQFCMGCGQPLWEPCIECDVKCHRGAVHCGSCGANLATAIESRLRAVEAAIANARRLARDQQWERAIKTLEPHVARPHPRLATSQKPASQLIAELTAQIERLDEQVAQTESEARRLIEAGSFAASIQLLEQLPVAKCTVAIQDLIDTAKSRLSDAELFEREIRQDLAESRFDGLMHKVEGLLRLKPVDVGMLKLHADLQIRETARTKKRCDGLQHAAMAALRDHRYGQAVRILEQIEETARTPAIEKLLRQSTLRANEVGWLTDDLRGAVTLDEHLPPIAQRLLNLQPNDAAAIKFANSLEVLSKADPESIKRKADHWPGPQSRSVAKLPLQIIKDFGRIDTSRISNPEFAKQPEEYCVAAGLALQGLQQAVLKANLAPRKNWTAGAS